MPVSPRRRFAACLSASPSSRLSTALSMRLTKMLAALRPVVNRAQLVGGGTDISDRQMLVDRGDAVVGLGLELLQRGRVFVGLTDRLLEDRWVGGHALQPVALDERAQLPLLDQAAL